MKIVLKLLDRCREPGSTEVPGTSSRRNACYTHFLEESGVNLKELGMTITRHSLFLLSTNRDGNLVAKIKAAKNNGSRYCWALPSQIHNHFFQLKKQAKIRIFQ
jgi:hypothetical protein